MFHPMFCGSFRGQSRTLRAFQDRNRVGTQRPPWTRGDAADRRLWRRGMDPVDNRKYEVGRQANGRPDS